MKSYDEFKTIAYKNAVPHTVYRDGKSQKINKGKAVPVRSHSSAGGNGDSGNGGGGNGGGNGGGGNGGE